ncbi:hypothetical protein ACA910_006509 [Epithemia clementina (nom. ined.)]
MSNNPDEMQKAQDAAAAARANEPDDTAPTIFDKLLSGEIPTTKVYDDDLAMAFGDVNPMAPTHILVIPKHRDGLTQLCRARVDQKAVLGHLLYVAGQLGQQHCPQGYRVVVNDGADGGQSVYHLHLHVLGGRTMSWPPG